MQPHPPPPRPLQQGQPPPWNPPQPPKRKRPWFKFGCLPIIVLLLLLIVANAINESNKNNVALPPTTVTSTVPSTPGPGEITTTVPGAPSSEAPPTTAVARPGGEAQLSSCASQEGLFLRECGVAAPPNIAAGEKLPVVILLHGMLGNPNEVRAIGDWTNRVVDRRFILITPGGLGASWNAGGCCSIAQATNLDDVGYLAGVVREASTRPEVDASRIYMAGFSNGGMMVYRYLCAAGDGIAAAASVAGTSTVGCAPTKSMPILHIHGVADATVPYQGGQSLAAFVLGVTFRPVVDTMIEMAADEGCGAQSTDTRTGNVSTRVWSGCGNGAMVRLDSIDGLNHNWPLAGGFNGTDEMLSFFGI